MRLLGPVAVLALLACLAGSAVSAATITVTFSGTISFVSSQIASGPFVAGNSANGSFQIDSTSADSDPAPTEGQYVGAVSNLSFSFGGYTGTGGSSNELHMRNGSGFTVDNFFVQSDVVGSDVAGFPPFHFLFDLGDIENTIFSSDAIPASLDLADFEVRNLILGFVDGTSVYNVDASLTSVTYSVPEPGGLALLALGGAALAALRRQS